MNIQILKEELERLRDPRHTSRGNIRHKLEDFIIIGARGVIKLMWGCGNDNPGTKFQGVKQLMAA